MTADEFFYSMPNERDAAFGTNGYTQAHYDLLTGPWRQVMGPLHADDDRPRPAVCVHGSPWLGVIRGSIALSGGVR